MIKRCPMHSVSDYSVQVSWQSSVQQHYHQSEGFVYCIDWYTSCSIYHIPSHGRIFISVYFMLQGPPDSPVQYILDLENSSPWQSPLRLENKHFSVYHQPPRFSAQLRLAFSSLSLSMVEKGQLRCFVKASVLGPGSSTTSSTNNKEKS